MRRLLAHSAVFVALGCSRTQPPAIDLSVGIDPGEKKSFVPETALAEYVALPGVKNELRITLASYAIACEQFVVPPPGQVLVNVVITTPPDQPPDARSYPWAGEGAPFRALPSAELGSHAYEFPPGGEVRLDQVELDPHGSVRGLLAFSFPGDATRPAKSLSGAFEARICRFSGPP
jgi:hypothetical protein